MSKVTWAGHAALLVQMLPEGAGQDGQEQRLSNLAILRVVDTISDHLLVQSETKPLQSYKVYNYDYTIFSGDRCILFFLLLQIDDSTSFFLLLSFFLSFAGCSNMTNDRFACWVFFVS